MKMAGVSNRPSSKKQRDDNSTTSPLAIELGLAERFLSLLAGDTPVTFQTFDEQHQRPELALKPQGPLSARAAYLQHLNRKGAGVFVMVNEGDGQGRKAENVSRVRALFIDLDGAPLDPIRTAPLKPHLIVESSPDRFHCYWLVEGVRPEAFRPAQKFLAEQYGGDETVCDLPRVMRLPGFLHLKGKPFKVNLKEHTPGKPYTPERLEAAWPGIFTAQIDSSAPALHTASSIRVGQQSTRASTSRDGISRRALAALEGERAAVLAAPEGRRNNILNIAAFNLGQLVGVSELAREAVEDELMEAAMQSGLNREEAAATIKSGLDAGMGKPRPKRNMPAPKAQAEQKAKGNATAEAKPSDKQPSTATILVKLARGGIRELFHDSTANGYATFSANGHLETWPLKTRQFKLWLKHLYYTGRKGTPNSQAVDDAVGQLESIALFEGQERAVHLRVAECEGKLYLDLADNTWRVVEVDTSGWRVLSESPVKFRRRKGMQPLPVPESGGSLADLRQFVNVADDDWPLLLSYLAACFRPSGPYPILVLIGGEGRGKSTQAKILRNLFDPSEANLRTSPDNERTLMLAANNSHLLAFDNLSNVPNWLSDALSRLATGGSFTTKKLYEDDEETIFSACRPVILTGIDELGSRPDLLSRCLLIELPEIHERRLEAELLPAFEAKRPALLGALLTAVSAGLKELPHTTLDDLPRMADFALWATACERGLGLEPGAFKVALELNRAGANELTLENSPLAIQLRRLLEANGGHWRGTSNELLDDLLVQLRGRDDTRTERLAAWPKDAARLGKTLRRLETSLKRAGLTVGRERMPDKGRTRVIVLALESPTS